MIATAPARVNRRTIGAATEPRTMTTPIDEIRRQLAPRGELRVAINLGNPVLARKSAATGALEGVTIDLAREIARRIGLPGRLIEFDAAAKVVDAAARDVWDVAFVARDPARAGALLFTSPYVLIEATFLVPRDSAFQAPGDLDRGGVRIAVGRGAAYELHLRRAFGAATLIHGETSAQAMRTFAEGGADAVAGIKQALQGLAEQRPEFRMIRDPFATIAQAVAVPAGRPLARQYLEAFVEQARASGFVAAALALLR